MNPGPPPGREPTQPDQHLDRPTANPVESRMRGNAHVRLGGRKRANHRAQARHGGPLPTLLLDRPAQGAHAQRPRLARRTPRAAADLRRPLPPDRPTIRLDLHPRRPRPPPRQDRRPRATPPARGLTIRTYGRIY